MTRSACICANVSSKFNYYIIYFQGEKVLHKYVAIYAAYLITEKKPNKALELYSNYGAPPNPQVSLDFFGTSVPLKA